jgi:hypothetical protein
LAISAKPAGSSATLNATTAQTSLIPDRPGTYEITLTVGDGHVTTSVTRSFTTTNSPPVANAGADQSAPVGTTVTLNGGAFDGR